MTAFLLPWQAGSLLLRTRQLWAVALLPLAVNFLLYVALMTLAVWAVFSWQPVWLQELHEAGMPGNAVAWSLIILKWIVAMPVLLVVVYFSFTAVGMVVAAPFNDLLSARVEQVAGAAAPEAVPSCWMTQVAATMLGSLRLLGLQIFCSLLVIPFLLVPAVGFVPLLLVTGYFGGLAMVDVAVARHDPTAGRLSRAIPGRRREVLALGVAMELLFFIPFAGLLFLPLGVTAGTLMHERWKGVSNEK